MQNAQDKSKYLLLDIVELSFIAGLSSFKSLNNKARKQGWPHLKQQRAQGGPIHLYPLSGLPDDLQIAWALWTPEKVESALAEEARKGAKARPERVPPATDLQAAERALGLSLRSNFYRKIAREDLLGGHQRRVYDGKSRGICPEARGALLERFPSLSGTETEPQDTEDLMAAEDSPSWGAGLHSQFVYVPHYQIQASAGFGSDIDSEQIIDHLAFHKSWVQNHLRVSAEGLALIHVVGDSMEPTLCADDLILIDMGQREIKDGLLYVLRLENNLIVKRLERLLNGKVKLCSDNNNYSDQTVDPKDPDERPQIVGRVVWFGREI